ncbi:MAG: PilZ domain-containing protein [Bdellovibrio sp.]|nr:PilZ domain-containing protein [Bdellovibrio sp.]
MPENLKGKSHSKFNLIKNQEQVFEKRVLPRFPFTFMAFRLRQVSCCKIFEVRDLSLRGAHIALKDGAVAVVNGEQLDGEIVWKGKKVPVSGKVIWVKGQSLGLEFCSTSTLENDLMELLSLENVAADFRPLHENPLQTDLPSNLKYWLKADGPAEVFVWQHNDGELARFQFLFLDHFVEWEDGRGIKTGRMVNVRDIETPLAPEDEFMFEMDGQVDHHKIGIACKMMDRIPNNYIPENTTQFLRMKLSATC